MANDDALRPALERLIAEDAVGQLRRREGRMAALGSEGGALKLDWVEAVARMLADPVGLEQVEAEARAIRARGIRHIIWAGMGGSVLTVRVLCALGFGGEQGDAAPRGDGGATIALHRLDSTDPAALNAIVRRIAAGKQLALADEPARLRALLGDVLMVGVALGMTSEEPITHLEWFTHLLHRAGLAPAEHLLVTSLPGSYLDTFARAHQAPRLPLQLDGGTGTGGRMSAPGTRVFLLPAALYLTGVTHEVGALRAVLRQAWEEYDLERATSASAEHPFVRLGAALSAASVGGACRVLVRMPEGWGAFVAWLEQLMEESLGKGGKGVVVFNDQPLDTTAPGYAPEGLLRVRVVAEADGGAARLEADAGAPQFVLPQPALARPEPRARLAALAASFLGWQLSMALYGYLQGIQFAGQPAVENYKARARALRTRSDPLASVAGWQPAVRAGGLTLLAPAGTATVNGTADAREPAAVFARALRAAVAHGGAPGHDALSYLDVTGNGEAPERLLVRLDEWALRLGNTLLGVPLKLRRAPAAYHSTEQSEMDGPPTLVSLRIVARTTEACVLGTYGDAFLHAQAVSTWQAMLEAGRRCFLLVVDGTLADADAYESLADFMARVEAELRGG